MANLNPQTLDRLNSLVNSDKFSSLNSETQDRVKKLVASNATNPQPDTKTNNESRPSILSSFVRGIMRNSPLEQMDTVGDLYANQDKIPNPVAGESLADAGKRAAVVIAPREMEIAKKGTISQLERPMGAALAMGGAMNPVGTAKMLGKFMVMDKASNAVGLNPDNIPDSMPEVKDLAQIGKFAAEGALAGTKWSPEKKTNEQILDKYADAYRKVLSPGKGVINKTEIKSGKDLQDTFKLAAQEGLIIHKDADGKIDTTEAIAKLKPKTDELNQELNQALDSDKSNRFNLGDLKDLAKKELSKTIKNPLDLKNARTQAEKEIDAAIEEYGHNVSGSQLNTIKQGMWAKSYDQLAPNDYVVANKIGHVVKDLIERNYPEQNIKGINQQLGKYYDLRNILQNSHGNVVKSGKLGRYFAQGAGAVVGAPLPYVGPLVGGYAGGKIADFINSPERVTGSISKKVGKLKNLGTDSPTRKINNPVLSRFNPVGKKTP